MNAARFARHLIEDGVDQKLADSLAEHLADEIERTVATRDHVEMVVTREVQQLRVEMHQEFQRFDERLTQRLDTFQNQMTQRLDSQSRWLTTSMIVRRRPARSDRELLPARPPGTCAPPDRGRQVPPDPVLIVEILSSSTALHDRARKVDAYCLLPSVKEVLLIGSDERRVQHWTRDGARWTVENLIGSADLRLDLVPEPLSLDAIYDATGM